MKIKQHYIFWKNQFKVSQEIIKLILFMPIAAYAFMLLIIINPSTRNFSYWLLKENNPIEILTFIIFFFGGVYGIFNTVKLKNNFSLLTVLFYGGFSLVLVILALEEIAWGQQFFHFKTPDEWLKINTQEETTLHNLTRIQGKNDILCLIYGFGGLIGILISRYFKSLKTIGVPIILLSIFLIIFFHSIIDVFVDVLAPISNLRRLIRRLTEFIELYIAISALLYLWLNFKRLELNYTSLKD